MSSNGQDIILHGHPADHFILRCRHWHQPQTACFSALTCLQRRRRVWTRRTHASFESATNRLFATLLLGVQRLEEAGVLLLAHQAMLEDMLECWTWGNTEELEDCVVIGLA